MTSKAVALLGVPRWERRIPGFLIASLGAIFGVFTIVTPRVVSAAGCVTPRFGAATNFSVGTKPFSVAVGDFNIDGLLDLAVANEGSNTVSILLGSGTGSFGPATNYSVGTNPVSVAVSELNGDSHLDLAVANNGSNTVSILLGSGTGSFGMATNYTVGANPFSVAVSAADGTLDLAVANSTSNTVSILPSTCLTHCVQTIDEIIRAVNEVLDGCPAP